MKATGIVRRIDDLGRVVIPKEIRRTMRIREGDPLLTSLTADERALRYITELGNRLESWEKLLVQLLDNTDENLDASKNAYDGIFNQIAGFSKETKNHLSILERRVEEFDKVAEQGRKIAEAYYKALSNIGSEKQQEILSKLSNARKQDESFKDESFKDENQKINEKINYKCIFIFFLLCMSISLLIFNK